MRSFVFLAAGAMALSVPVGAQTAAASQDVAAARSVTAAEARKVVAELATQLEENFVFPDVARAYAARLRERLAGGAYDQFTDAKAFAAAVTADLQAVHSDGHLRLHLVEPETRRGSGNRPRVEDPGYNAISKSGWLAPGVAYIRFESFPGSEATLAALKSFLDTHGNATSLIIDARSHHGGGLAEMDLLFARLFDAPTTLVAMDTRAAADERSGVERETEWALRTIAGPEGVVRREHFVVPAKGGKLAKAKVYLLTSRKSVSAAEHLALSLKRTGRATLIGETTRGAGHYGGMVPVGDGFAAFIPVGRTFDPDTGQGWEGVGVAPHVAVPADEALDEALRRAGASVTAQAALASIE